MVRRAINVETREQAEFAPTTEELATLADASRLDDAECADRFLAGLRCNFGSGSLEVAFALFGPCTFFLRFFCLCWHFGVGFAAGPCASACTG